MDETTKAKARNAAEEINRRNRARNHVLVDHKGEWDYVMPTEEMAEIIAAALQETRQSEAWKKQFLGGWPTPDDLLMRIQTFLCAIGPQLNERSASVASSLFNEIANFRVAASLEPPAETEVKP